MEIHQIPATVQLIKRSKSEWSSFAYKKCQDVYGYDSNALRRFAVIIQLQYDKTVSEEDKEFLEFLMQQEIDMHRSHPYQGAHESMDILAYLLAKFKDVHHIRLFEQAKLSNFDTYYGFDSEYLFSAGIEEAIRYVEENDLYTSSSYFQGMEDEIRTLFTAEYMERWLQTKTRSYPINQEDESLSTLMDRAVVFGDIAEARRLLAQLEASSGSEKSDYSYLYYRCKELEEYDKALTYLTKLTPYQEEASDRVSLSLKFAGIYMGKEIWDQAFASVKQCQQELNTFTSWKRNGLGRSLSEALLDISLGAREWDRSLAKEAYSWADQMLRVTNNDSYVILKKAHQCARMLRLRKDKRRYGKECRLEARRIKKMIGRRS
ncbi:hypothetical protein BRE01_35600 [Brevibacillus reuszeri]|uniref:Uncharacterized protein n=1 Tax=Brevibacillus reuszeri TaxID=54915 RepID=A0A0K9YPV1_9BACL|nr:hypothetical protein [Brevibacillus reuszeri]KNB70682.1 hypothetical protein ADS79_17525 [Brevibacillus reuszeri]MED1861316.1 hypothetical protein [Brevibacillus reuszeri]GED69858.1 hypothetical protein BRE01_35600 [Brevibacillus reuszeri]